jgi:hypothetical protein
MVEQVFYYYFSRYQYPSYAGADWPKQNQWGSSTRIESTIAAEIKVIKFFAKFIFDIDKDSIVSLHIFFQVSIVYLQSCQAYCDAQFFTVYTKVERRKMSVHLLTPNDGLKNLVFTFF